MSLSAEAEAAELFAAFDSLRTSDWVAFASTAFLIYDYTLTLDREVKLFWTKRFTSVTILYLVIRYSALTYVVLDTLEPAPILTAESCLALFKVVDGIEAGRWIPLAAFSAMRAYSLAKSRTISALIFISSLAPLAANLVQYGKGMDSVIIPINHLCVETDTFTPEDVVILTLVSRLGLIIADVVLVVLTWRTLGRGPLRPRLPHASRGSLASVMLWNGLLYFIALLVLNVLHLSLSLAAVFGTTNGPSNVTLLIDPIMTILVARLMLDLQEANQRDVKLDSGDALHLSQSEGSSSFVRGMGSIRSLVFVDDGEEDSRDGEVQEIGSSHA